MTPIAPLTRTARHLRELRFYLAACQNRAAWSQDPLCRRRYQADAERARQLLTENRRVPQRACDRCTQGVMDADWPGHPGNDHLYGRCRCSWWWQEQRR
jgi:hypothetical protein